MDGPVGGTLPDQRIATACLSSPHRVMAAPVLYLKVPLWGLNMRPVRSGSLPLVFMMYTTEYWVRLNAATIRC